jgi:glycosyltransferase involved in cell wall biosynthesis
MSEPITAFICTQNEEANIADCIAHVEGVDEVLIADDGSTDRTKEIAESLGARVFQREHYRTTVTTHDVLAFAEKYGWNPAFVAGQELIDGESEYNTALAECTHDWVVIPDADERVFWDLPKLREEVLPEADQVACPFAHARDWQTGEPSHWGKRTKMFRRSTTRLAGCAHGIILPAGRIVETDLMRMEHWRDPAKGQSGILPLLEYSVLKADTQRDHFYLGREYYYHYRFEHSLLMLNRYLAKATWQPEIAQARLHAAACYWELGRGEEARKSCLEAILINPDHKAALELYAEMHYEPWRSKWQFIADNATDDGILF